MEIIIAMLIGIVAAILGVIVALVIIFCRIKENNELLKTIYFGVRDIYVHLIKAQDELTEKEPETKIEPKPCEKFIVGAKIIGIKGNHTGEIYTIGKINLRLYEAVLVQYTNPSFEYLHVHLDDLENEFMVLEDLNKGKSIFPGYKFENGHSEDLKPSEELKHYIDIAKKFKVGTKVIAMKGIYIGEVYKINSIDFLTFVAVLTPCSGPAIFRYLAVHLDDLENEFVVLKDEE